MSNHKLLDEKKVSKLISSQRITLLVHPVISTQQLFTCSDLRLERDKAYIQS